MHPRCLCLEALRQGEVLFFSSSRSSQGPPPLSTLVLCLPAHGEHVKHTSRPVGVRHSHPGKPINAHDSLLLLSTLFILLCVASAPTVQRALGDPVTGSLSLSLSLSPLLSLSLCCRILFESLISKLRRTVFAFFGENGLLYNNIVAVPLHFR